MKKDKLNKCRFCKKEIKEKGYDLVNAFLIEFSSCSQYCKDGSSVSVEYDYLICKKCYNKYAKPIIKDLEKLENE